MRRRLAIGTGTRLAGLALALLMLAGCAAIAPAPQALDYRLAAFPTEDLPLDGPVSVHWNTHQVPFIEADTDHDLAVTLGLVHAHLREGQLALMRRVAEGRLSEIAGPLAHDLDHALRIIDFDYAVDALYARMPQQTKDWLAAYVDGLNAYQERSAPPPEFGLLGLTREPWTVRDILTLGRLAGTDVYWGDLVGQSQARLREDWPEHWRRRLIAGGTEPPSAKSSEQAALEKLFERFGRWGSNAVAVAPQRSKTGAALIANDPHLGLSLPNIWLLAGYKSPSYHAVGMMLPGLPFMALGRSPDLAWGGTNLRAQVSDLYDVSGLPEDAFETEDSVLSARFWPDRTLTVRRSPLGPVLSDSNLIAARPGETLAIRWVGHEPFDEITAYLAANRAKTVREFRAALADYAVSAQNFIVVDRQGSIGHIFGVQLPERPWLDNGAPDDPVLNGADPALQWQGYRGALELPAKIDPPEGFIASSNNRPDFSDTTIGLFFGGDERYDRFHALAERAGMIGIEDLQNFQADVFSAPALALAEALYSRLAALPQAKRQHGDFLKRLIGWNGQYSAGSSGAVAFETLLNRLVRAIWTTPDGDIRPGHSDWRFIQSWLLKDLDALPADRRQTIFLRALRQAAADAAPYDSWGDMHRLEVAHYLAALPLIGSNFVYGDMPQGGSRETIMKSAHGLVDGKHRASYGAHARQISDMSDPDANWFVLFGGQDGWLGSSTFADQAPLFQNGAYIQMPLRPESVRRAFPREMLLRPAGAPTS